MLLHNLRGDAGREGVPAARQVSARYRLGDGRACGRHDVEALDVDILPIGRIGDFYRIGRARHLEHGEHIADPVDHRDGRGRALRCCLCCRPSDHGLNVGRGQALLRGDAEERSGRRRRWRRSRRRIATGFARIIPLP